MLQTADCHGNMTHGNFTLYGIQVRGEYNLPRAILTLIEHDSERKLVYTIKPD
jgi:hypothetical protein